MQTKEKRCMKREVASAGMNSVPRKFDTNLIIQAELFQRSFRENM
jgi:hypothetical protein